MADKEIKITTLTEQQREVLKSKTPFILPDNPSQKGYSASQIKKTMYEPVLLLFDWLKRQGLETKEAFEYLNNYIFEKGNALSEDIENSKKYAKDLVDNLALTVDGNLTESKNYTDLEIDKVELDYNGKFANVTKDVNQKHQAVTKRLDEHDSDIETLEEQVKDLFSIRQANLKIVNSVDDVKENNVIYLIKDEEAVGTDIYKEYILVDGVATLIGDTSVDLRPYLTAKQIAEQYPSKTEVDEKLDEKIGDIDSLLDKLNGTSTMGLILLDGSVTTKKIADGSVTPEKLDIFKSKCKLIESYKDIIYFDNLTNKDNVTIKDSTKTYFSNKSKLCYAIKQDGITQYNVELQVNISNWNSLTFVFYIPYETYINNLEHSGYIDGYCNYANSTFSLNGKYKEGWNVIKLRRGIDIYNPYDTITKINFRINSRSSVLTGNDFGYITFDSIIVDMKMKPCVLLNFDQIWEETITNGGYDLLFNNNIPFTLFTHNFNNLSEAQKEIIRKSINMYNCEFGIYGGANGNNTIINSASSTYLQKFEDIQANKSEYLENWYKHPISYASSQGILTPKMEEAIMNNGFKMIRALSGVPMGYFDKNSNWITHIEFSSMSSNQVKTLIDNAIVYGDTLPIFTHGIKNDSGSTISSTSISLSAMIEIVNYLVEKRNNGEIEILTFEEFYHKCID